MKYAKFITRAQAKQLDALRPRVARCAYRFVDGGALSGFAIVVAVDGKERIACASWPESYARAFATHVVDLMIDMCVEAAKTGDYGRMPIVPEGWPFNSRELWSRSEAIAA